MCKNKYLYIFINITIYKKKAGWEKFMVWSAANEWWIKIDEVSNNYLKHITDSKPITVRQCIKVLHIVAKYKLELKNDIIRVSLVIFLRLSRSNNVFTLNYCIST